MRIGGRFCKLDELPSAPTVSPMPRTARLHYPGGLFHVISRCVAGKRGARCDLSVWKNRDLCRQGTTLDTCSVNTPSLKTGKLLRFRPSRVICRSA